MAVHLVFHFVAFAMTVKSVRLSHEVEALHEEFQEELGAKTNMLRSKINTTTSRATTSTVKSGLTLESLHPSIQHSLQDDCDENDEELNASLLSAGIAHAMEFALVFWGYPPPYTTFADLLGRRVVVPVLFPTVTLAWYSWFDMWAVRGWSALMFDPILISLVILIIFYTLVVGFVFVARSLDRLESPEDGRRMKRRMTAFLRRRTTGTTHRSSTPGQRGSLRSTQTPSRTQSLTGAQLHSSQPALIHDTIEAQADPPGRDLKTSSKGANILV